MLPQISPSPLTTLKEPIWPSQLGLRAGSQVREDGLTNFPGKERLYENSLR